MSQTYWMNKHFSFFFNRECEYFPCHADADPENFNCLFCYCPLYVLGDRCGGSFVYLDNGFKDCSLCLYPHLRENYGAIIDRYREILQNMPPRRETLLSAAEHAEDQPPYAALLQEIAHFPDATDREKAAVQSAVRYIHDHLRQPIRLRDLTQECELSVYYFAHAFKKLTGFSPIEYVQHTRIEQAQHLLQTTALSIEAIASQVGYQSSSTFSALFSKKRGITPGEFRRTAKTQGEKQDKTLTAP